jgi:DNA-binding NtrC family response regulator
MHTIMDVENDAKGALTLSILLGGDYRIIHCRDCAKALTSARKGEVEALILDLDLEEADSFDLLLSLGKLRQGPPVIVLSRNSDPRTVVRAIKSGAADFIHKPPPLHELKLAVARACDRLVDASSPFAGTSQTMVQIMKMLRCYAAWDFPLLITGESGTGKDLAARTVHELSSRKNGAFVARNCAAFPAELVESELFGSKRGAFTGALDRPGAFELATNGTLFLDEIGEASEAVQAKLLRVLESGEVWRLGAQSAISSDVRFVSATSRKLREAAKIGAFRIDLLYRIETLILEMPPLRERREDIAELAKRFIAETAPGRKHASPVSLELLSAGNWPGNVRQLRNVVQRAIALSGDRDEIGEEDILM